MPRGSLVFLGAVLGLAPLVISCEVAPISAPEQHTDIDEAAFTVVEDWPKLPRDRAFGRVLGVAVAPDGKIWVAHTADGGPRNDTPIRGATLAVLDPETGDLLAERGAGIFRLPHALAFDDTGLLWVTDADANQIFVLDQDGRVLRTIGED